MDNPLMLFFASCFGIFVAGISAQFPQSPYGGGAPVQGYGGSQQQPYGAQQPAYGAAGGAPDPASRSGYGGGYPSGGGSGYTYGQGSGVYFKKPVPIDEKPIFFRTPYWLPNMYYGHYGYPWTEWFDGGPRFVVPIMTAYPHGGGGTQTYNTGYGGNTGQAGYPNGVAPPAAGSYQGGYPVSNSTAEADATTTVDPLNDGFSYYKGVPMYQTYYEKYLVLKTQSTTVAPAGTS
ncbi:hypothetical protein BV898_05032 [Hypsibius exemplaris]|uniref:Uncharacterized protein n=1 Tax=Hypsibius exemplaris TaxID=2072580 RepID=A0A1W0X0F4_HYPEX|nr:hypothetical protein BV898_05032 [Hypsibius exemplaris]